MAKKIIGLTYINENQALGFATDCYITLFKCFGYDAETVDLSAPDGIRRLQNHLQSGEVDFCFALQGVGSRLTMGDGSSVWTHFQTPFLSLHHDNPSCNIYNHFCDSYYVGNIYLFKSFLDIQQRYINGDRFNGYLPYQISSIPYTEKVRFADRPLRMSFMKSGKSPSIYADKINQIHAPMRDAIWVAIDKAWQNENLVICDLLAEAFTICGHDYKQFWAEFWGFADLIENYLRSKRAAEMVNWLKLQEGAVIIGDGWDFIDKTDAKAIFKPSISGAESMAPYSQSKFILNTTPYGSDIIHERVTLGLCRHGFVISDTNAWWDEHFSDVPSLFRLHWNQRLNDQLADVINDPHAAEKADSDLGARRIEEKLYGNTQIPILVSIADRVRDFVAKRREEGGAHSSVSRLLQ